MTQDNTPFKKALYEGLRPLFEDFDELKKLSIPLVPKDRYHRKNGLFIPSINAYHARLVNINQRRIKVLGDLVCKERAAKIIKARNLIRLIPDISRSLLADMDQEAELWKQRFLNSSGLLGLPAVLKSAAFKQKMARALGQVPYKFANQDDQAQHGMIAHCERGGVINFEPYYLT